jgi:[protein-PII] uridylyltransferase
MSDRDDLFAITTRLFAQLRLNIVSAHIETADDGRTLNSFLVLEENGAPVEDKARKAEITNTLKKALSDPDSADDTISVRVPRRMKHFSTPTRLDFILDSSNQRTMMKLVADDRPGLLSQIGHAFVDCGMRLINAKIATVGAEANDVFFITDRENRPLSQRSQFVCLEQAVRKHLSGD